MLKAPKFPAARTNFQAEVKSRVELYFTERGIASTGNWKLYAKTFLILFYFVAVYVALVFFHFPVWLGLLLCVALAVGVAAIGFNIMHDGAHGSFSESRTVNDLAANTLDVLGASSYMWKTKHNVVHHTYTNIHEFDDDINVRPLLRLAPEQKWLSIHKYQHIYGIPLYGLLHIIWIVYKDFLKYFSGKVGNTPVRKMNLKEEIVFWGSKVSFLFFFVFLPIYFQGIVPFLIGFTVFSLCTGIFISVVFQLAHVVGEVEFLLPDKEFHKMENEWAIHQVVSTANFATDSKLVTWFVGGLNFQIEHHLFPKISHVHYPAISKIVKQTCEEFGIKYHEFATTRAAVAEHISFLKRLGTAA